MSLTNCKVLLYNELARLGSSCRQLDCSVVGKSQMPKRGRFCARKPPAFLFTTAFFAENALLQSMIIDKAARLAALRAA